MAADLRGLGRTVELRRPRRGRRVTLVVAVLVVAGAVAARAGDEQDARLDELVLPPDPAVVAEEPPATGPGAAADTGDAAGDEVPAVALPLLGRVGDLVLRVPAEEAVLVSYHEAAYLEALPITPFGSVSGNDNPTRELTSEPDAAALDFHVQVSRGRANAPTSAVDVVLLPGEEVRAPVAGTVVDIRHYKLYGAHDDVRVELRPDDAPDRAVVLIHVQDVVVRAGDRVQVGDVLAGAARMFPFSGVVDRQTAPDRYGHVHLEVKRPTAD